VPRSKNKVELYLYSLPLLSPRAFVAYKKGETYLTYSQTALMVGCRDW
jgi:hypothetical protein